jgi:hypothetical protein
MTSYIIGDDNKNNYDLEYIPYGEILQERIKDAILSPDNIIQCILYTLHLAGHFTYEYYTSVLKQLYLYALSRINNGILSFGEEVNLGLTFDINLRIFITTIISKKKMRNDISYIKYEQILKALDKFMFKLLININDDIFDILHRDVYVRSDVFDNYKNALLTFEREVLEFRRLYKEKEQRILESKTIFKTFYRKEIPLDIAISNVNQFI